MHRKSMENLKDRGKEPWDSINVDKQSSRSTDCPVPKREPLCQLWIWVVLTGQRSLVVTGILLCSRKVACVGQEYITALYFLNFAEVLKI